MNKEIEIRMKCENSSTKKKLFAYLDKYARQTSADEFQIDSYFTPSHRDFLKETPVKEWLRIRKTAKGSAITYKNWGFSKGKTTHVCKELESNIENIESFTKILIALDFQNIVNVEKTRSSYMLDGIEISIDNVKGLGFYVELENKTQEGLEKEILMRMNELAQELV